VVVLHCIQLENIYLQLEQAVAQEKLLKEQGVAEKPSVCISKEPADVQIAKQKDKNERFKHQLQSLGEPLIFPFTVRNC